MANDSHLLARSISWIKSWFITARVSRRIDAMTQRLDDLETSRAATVTQLKKRERELHKIHASYLRERDSFLDEWNDTWQSAQTDFESNQSLIKQYEFEVEALRTKLQICEEVIIPDLTGALKTMSEANETIISLENQRKQMAIDPLNRTA